jgi:hypothetical protein
LLSDPLSITYDGSAKSLPRVSSGPNSTVYRTSDGVFEIRISNAPGRGSDSLVRISFSRVTPDPTPSDAFDPYRTIRNSFELCFSFDISRYEASTVLPLLRTALLAFVDTTLQGRLIAGEK